MSDTAREEVLEQALQASIDYLKALPLHPATATAIRAAEKALAEKPDVHSPKAGYQLTPAGFIPIAARLIGNKLTLFTTDVYRMPQEWQREYAFKLYNRLLDGVEVELKVETSETRDWLARNVGRNSPTPT